MVEGSELSTGGRPLDWSRSAPASLEWVVAGLLGATILLVAAGSSWRPDLSSDVKNLRWLLLFALCVASLELARRCLALGAVTALERRGAILISVFAGLCVLSAAWSVVPKLTLERTFTVILVLATSAAIAFSAARRPELVPMCLRAILAAIGLLLLASLVLGLVDPGAAFQHGMVRFRGVLENPDTLPLLAAYGLPLGAWLALEGERVERVLAVTGLVAIVLLMGATGSRGGLVAGTAGLLVFVWLVTPSALRAFAMSVGIVVVLGASLAITPLMAHVPGTEPSPAQFRLGAVFGSVPLTVLLKAQPFENPAYPLSLGDEIGRPLQPTARHGRNLFSSSGRVEAWVGAIHQADQRPLLGFGFGTEDRVFVDRFYSFQGARAENTFVGTYLQLGAAGVVALCVLLGWAVLVGARAVLDLAVERRRLVAAVGSVAVAGLVEMLVQSFATSAGDIAMLTFWVCLGLFATAREWARA